MVLALLAGLLAHLQIRVLIQADITDSAAMRTDTVADRTQELQPCVGTVVVPCYACLDACIIYDVHAWHGE